MRGDEKKRRENNNFMMTQRKKIEDDAFFLKGPRKKLPSTKKDTFNERFLTFFLLHKKLFIVQILLLLFCFESAH